MRSKISEVVDFCRGVLVDYERPALMCSFGKDSMVLLHILRDSGVKLPILCYRDPWQPKKWAFANRIIEKWDLVVWNYPPLHVSMLYGNNKVVMVDDHECGDGVTISIPHGIVEDNNGLCGRWDVFERPRARFYFPWDMCLVGHRDVDVDAIYGAVPLHKRILKREVGPSFCFPLKDWTDEEVWDYIERTDVPYDVQRYDIWKREEFADKTLNSDYRSVCISCLDKRKSGQKVFCPRVNEEIDNISERVPEFHKVPDYFSTEV